MEKRWREAVETLETNELSARNSPEKREQSTKDRDRVSLLPGSRSKYCLSCERAVLGRKTAFFTARRRLWEGGGNAQLRSCLPAPACLPKLLLWSRLSPSSVPGGGNAEPRGTRRGPGHPKSVPSSCGTPALTPTGSLFSTGLFSGIS